MRVTKVDHEAGVITIGEGDEIDLPTRADSVNFEVGQTITLLEWVPWWKVPWYWLKRAYYWLKRCASR